MSLRFLLVGSLIATLSACIAITPSENDNNTEVITVPAPIVIGKQSDVIIIEKNKPQTNSVYVCTMSAFTRTYKSENSNRGQARLDVKKQCLSNFHEMHCPDTKISCKEY